MFQLQELFIQQSPLSWGWVPSHEREAVQATMWRVEIKPLINKHSNTYAHVIGNCYFKSRIGFTLPSLMVVGPIP